MTSGVPSRPGFHPSPLTRSAGWQGARARMHTDRPDIYGGCALCPRKFQNVEEERSADWFVVDQLVRYGSRFIAARYGVYRV